MTTWSPGFWPLLLLLFFVATPVFPQNESPAFRAFLKRHQDNPKSDFQNDRTYCNQMMRRRNLNCQHRNTFIHARDQLLASICQSKGKLLNGNKTSKTLFPITICTLGRGPKKLFCSYSGKSKIKRIRVTCRKGFPVHYISHA